MPDLVPDASAARRFPTAQLAGALNRATVAADLAQDDGAALDVALIELGDGLDGAFVAALVLEHERLWLAGTNRYAMIPDGLTLDEGVVGRAARTRETQYVDDVTSDGDFVEVVAGAVSQLAVPLMVDGRLLGILSIESSSAMPRPPAVAVEALAASLSRRLEGIRLSRVVDLPQLARLFVFISSLRHAAPISDLTSRALARVLPLDTSQVAVLREGEGMIESASWRASPEGPAPLSLAALRALHERVDRAAVFEVFDATTDCVDLVGAGVRSVIVIPLRAEGHDIGMLVGTSRFARRFERRQAEAAALLAAHAAASLDAAFALDRERTSALTDPLTGLLNRRGFDMRLERQLDEAQDERRPVSVLIIDCDDFKEVNDRAGHEFGDALLREMSDVLTGAVSELACVARLGGDEFVVMLPDTDGDTASEVANEIKGRLTAGLSDAGFPLHLSGGIATYPYDGAAGSQLLRAADQALYEAKGRGKDRVSTFRDVVRTGMTVEAAPADGRRGRSGRSSSATLADAAEAAEAIWGEESVEAVLARLGKGLTFVVGATGCMISRLEDGMLVDCAQHSLRDTTLGDAAAYLVDEFPLTKAVLEERRARALSFLDEGIDRAEAFVLRELGMNCVLLLPIVVGTVSWGLAEVYDMRLRSYGPEEVAISEFLVGQAGRKLETFQTDTGRGPRPPLFRLPG